MNVYELKRKALGYRAMADGDGGEGGSSAGASARNGDGFGGTGSGIGGDRSYSRDGGMSGGFSSTPSYAGYTTGSTQNAAAPAAVDAAREAYSSDKPDDGSKSITSLAERSQQTGEKLSDLLGREPDRSEAKSLAKAGFGDMTGINPNNERQSVNEFNASANVQAVLNATLPTLARMAIPGMGLVSMAQSIARSVENGDSPSDIAKTVVAGVVGQRLGVGAEAVGAAMNGNLGDAAALGIANKATNSLIGSAVSGLSDATGMTKGDVAAGMAFTGITGDVRNAVRSTALGVSNSMGSGFSPPSSDSNNGYISRSADPEQGATQTVDTKQQSLPKQQDAKPEDSKPAEGDTPKQGEAPKQSLSIAPAIDAGVAQRTTGAAFNGKNLQEIDKATAEINSVVGRGF